MARTSAKAKKQKQDVNKSKAVNEQQPENGEPSQDTEANHDSTDKENDDYNYEVEKIVHTRIYRGKRQYLVRWKGYKEDGDTWENESILQSCKEILEAFKKENPTDEAKDNSDSEAENDKSVKSEEDEEKETKKKPNKKGKKASTQKKSKKVEEKEDSQESDVASKGNTDDNSIDDSDDDKPLNRKRSKKNADDDKPANKKSNKSETEESDDDKPLGKKRSKRSKEEKESDEDKPLGKKRSNKSEEDEEQSDDDKPLGKKRTNKSEEEEEEEESDDEKPLSKKRSNKAQGKVPAKKSKTEKKTVKKNTESDKKEKTTKKGEATESDDESVTDGNHYEVEKILEVHTRRDGSREFLIRWKGYRPSEDTWEPEAHLDCTELIEKFMEKVEKAKSIPARTLRESRTPTNRFTPNIKSRGTQHNLRNSDVRPCYQE